MGAATGKNKNTSNLWSHLRIHHPDLHNMAQKKMRENEDAANKTQPTIVDIFQKQRKWTNSDDRSKLMDKLIRDDSH